MQLLYDSRQRYKIVRREKNRYVDKYCCNVLISVSINCRLLLNLNCIVALYILLRFRCWCSNNAFSRSCCKLFRTGYLHTMRTVIYFKLTSEYFPLLLLFFFLSLNNIFSIVLHFSKRASRARFFRNLNKRGS